MKRFTSLFIAAAIVAVLVAAWAAFSLFAPKGEGGGAASSGVANPAENVVLDDLDDLPDWLLVAYQRDCVSGQRCPRGDVKFNQRTITRNTDGTADIWIQARHGVTQTFAIEDAETRTVLRFQVERLHYRFNCTSAEFIVVERLIMGPNETVAARDEPQPVYRAPAPGSVTGLIQPIACRGS